MKTNRKYKHGLTLLEILAVIALLGIVMGFLVRNIFPLLTRGQSDSVRIFIKQLEGDLDRYRFDCNRYPTTAQGLNALIQKPAESPDCRNYDPNGYFSLKKQSIPRDPWDNEYIYTSENGQDYVIKSFGPDGQEGGDDDISSEDE